VYNFELSEEVSMAEARGKLMFEGTSKAMEAFHLEGLMTGIIRLLLKGIDADKSDDLR
jgi:hypothetical protein